MIQDGRYTLVYSNGEYRTVSIETVKDGDLKGKTILNLKQGSRYSGCAFLAQDNRVMFWRRFSSSNPSERMVAIQAAVNRIARNPREAGMAYAMNEGRCCRCGRELTVPASIHAGMGPDCAEKYAWAKEDQVAVHDELAETRKAGAVFADTSNQPEVPIQTSLKLDAPSVPDAAVASINVLPERIQRKAAVAMYTNDRMQAMIEYQRKNNPNLFYDPFDIGEKLNEKAAVAFWTKRFLASPLTEETMQQPVVA
jgi:hypothetical protein